MFDASDVVHELQDLRDQGYLSDALIRKAVRRIAESDDRFSWTGAYLLDGEGKELWLHNYVGAPTEHAKIPVGTGVCGTAVAEGANQNIPDVTAIENYLSCDAKVKAELVVLIRAGDEIFGQIDIDSREAGAFTDADEEAVQLVADKLAEQIAAERR
jgi:GAF domain-containing protein